MAVDWKLFPTHPFFTDTKVSRPFQQGCEKVHLGQMERMLKYQEGEGRVCVSLFLLLMMAASGHTSWTSGLWLFGTVQLNTIAFQWPTAWPRPPIWLYSPVQNPDDHRSYETMNQLMSVSWSRLSKASKVDRLFAKVTIIILLPVSTLWVILSHVNSSLGHVTCLGQLEKCLCIGDCPFFAALWNLATTLIGMGLG